MNQLILPKNNARWTINAIEIAVATERNVTKVSVRFWALWVRHDARLEPDRSRRAGIRDLRARPEDVRLGTSGLRQSIRPIANEAAAGAVRMCGLNEQIGEFLCAGATGRAMRWMPRVLHWPNAPSNRRHPIL